MKTNFHRNELPTAYSMIEAATRIRPRRDGSHHYQEYFTLWTAFNNIYTTIAVQKGLTPMLEKRADGTVVTIPNGSVNIPQVIPVGEREQIHLALEEFDEAIEHKLIHHKSTRYFLDRTPYWQGEAIKYDAFDQVVNGVIEVNSTSSPQYPVWSPIDLPAYERYLAAPQEEDRQLLCKQIVDLLYTVRDNLMHASKKFDDASDISVVRNALPLLEMIVADFTR